MTSNMALATVLLSALFCQYGCVGKIYVMKSQASLRETSGFSSTEIYSLHELTGGPRSPLVTKSGIELTILLRNEKVLHSYDTSLIIPVSISNPRDDVSIHHASEIPFIIFVRLRADGADATFYPSDTELYLGDNPYAVYPAKILQPINNKYCIYKEPPSGTTDVTEKIIPILDKSKITMGNKKKLKDWSTPHWSCLQFRFDTRTPDPSEKFYLKLGKIVTSSGKRIRPTIYFSPVTYVDITH